jgi:lipopolysaccharide export system permease protein
MRVRTTRTLWLYLAARYAWALAAVLAGLLALVYLFDTVELLRRAQGKDVPAALVLQMGLLKLPEVGQAIAPFAVLIAAMFTLWRLARSSELTVMRGAGLSPAQMIAPLVAVALAFAALQLCVVHPVGAALLARFERLEATHLKRQDAQVALFADGMWLRQDAPDGAGYVILHAGRVADAGRALHNVTALVFAPDDAQIARVDAPTGRLEPGRWVLEGPQVHRPDSPAPESPADWALPTGLTPADIARSFSGRAGMAVWALPHHIRVLESTGFDPAPLRVRYHALLATPAVFAAMVLLAAGLFIRPARGRGALARAGLGLLGGLAAFFATQFAGALGAAGQIPPAPAAWAPAGAALLAAWGLVLHLEEG